MTVRKGMRHRWTTQLNLPPPTPDLTRFERCLYAEGHKLIAGIDEAGRGCLAGPVVAAAVILPASLIIEGLTDSKKLTPSRREHYFRVIRTAATAWSWSTIDAARIDEINILQASLRAMEGALAHLALQPHAVLIDGNQPIQCAIPQRTVVKGDLICHSIAAASVVAKVMRDRMMVKLATRYPAFSFHVHKGYGTRIHLEELARSGPTPEHRMTFQGVCAYPPDE